MKNDQKEMENNDEGGGDTYSRREDGIMMVRSRRLYDAITQNRWVSF